MAWLVATMGTSPAVLTEAIWYLEQVEGLEVDRVTCIGTEASKTTAVAQIFTSEGPLDRLRRALDKPAEWLGAEGTLVWADEPLRASDNRNRAQALALDRACREVIRVAQEQGDGPVIACISGGRKTMSSSLQQAMTLLARPEDWAFHVLLQPDPDLPQEARKVLESGAYGFPDDPAHPHLVGKVRLDVFEIPIVRLRDFALGAGTRRLLEEDFITSLQRSVDEATAIPRLCLDLKTSRLELAWGDDQARDASTVLSDHQSLLLAGWIQAGGPIPRSSMAPAMEEVIVRLRDSGIIGIDEEEKLLGVVDAWVEPESKTIGPIQHELNDLIVNLHPALERFTIKSRWGRKPKAGQPQAGCFGFAEDVYAQGLISLRFGLSRR
ncbi:hypothetical protein GETHOR_08070 [Geothrix oryzae]|uniref:CRISPR system ring nuclease SSO2081-like domain-containing protein n=1 Tax=Geothrix oryzae TaxID=2927975 RepID=A0ABM8DP41_9BACT|nr:CRISPR-associated ring nuclease [Geothrix oryzae]BDU68706.1 hypothetical protein GETHOR_08070 [Geothrix oryzae]